MFGERYCKSFSVRVKIIAYNAIIIFCHLVEVAIFAISDFFSLFSIAVFNIPISHIIIVLLFLLQSYCFFRYFQIFLTFFYWSCVDHPHNRKIYFILHPFPVVVCSVGVLVVCPDDYLPTIIRTRIYMHTYARTRGFLERNF